MGGGKAEPQHACDLGFVPPIAVVIDKTYQRECLILREADGDLSGSAIARTDLSRWSQGSSLMQRLIHGRARR